MKRIIIIALAIILCFAFTVQAEPLVKAVFKVKWKDGTPQLPELPEGMDLYGCESCGISAMEHVTVAGHIDAEIVTLESVMNEIIANHQAVVKFVRYAEEPE